MRHRDNQSVPRASDPVHDGGVARAHRMQLYGMAGPSRPLPDPRVARIVSPAGRSVHRTSMFTTRGYAHFSAVDGENPAHPLNCRVEFSRCVNQLRRRTKLRQSIDCVHERRDILR